MWSSPKGASSLTSQSTGYPSSSTPGPHSVRPYPSIQPSNCRRARCASPSLVVALAALDKAGRPYRIVLVCIGVQVGPHLFGRQVLE
jgi:hypothetical protein